MATVTSEIMWVLNILSSLGIKNLLPVSLFCDNDSAIKIANNPVFHERTKHIEIDVHQVREKVSAGVIKTIEIQSVEQTADIQTE